MPLMISIVIAVIILRADVSICMLNVLAVGNNQEAENKFITVLIDLFASHTGLILA